MNNLQYFEKGFNLVKQNPKLYVISIIVGITSTFLNIESMELGVFSYLDLIFWPIFFLSLAYLFTTPYFYNQAIKKTKLNLSQIVSESLNNLKRMFLPSLLILPLIFLCFFLSNWLVNNLLKTGDSISNPDYFNTPAAYLAEIILYIILAPFAFAGIYFAILKVGLIKAFSKSFSYSLKHIKVLVLLTLFSLSNVLVKVLFGNQTLVQQLVNQFFFSAIGLTYTAISLLYYLDHSGNNKL